MKLRPEPTKSLIEVCVNEADLYRTVEGEPPCTDVSPAGFVCSRYEDHEAPHVACDAEQVVAVWWWSA